MDRGDSSIVRGKKCNKRNRIKSTLMADLRQQIFAYQVFGCFFFFSHSVSFSYSTNIFSVNTSVSLSFKREKRGREKEREMKRGGEMAKHLKYSEKILALYKITSPGQLGKTRIWLERKKVQFKDKFLFPNFFLNLFFSFVDLIVKTIF